MFHILFNNFKEKPFGLLPPFFFFLSLFLFSGRQKISEQNGGSQGREREKEKIHTLEH
jgi:hypothetical protein